MCNFKIRFCVVCVYLYCEINNNKMRIKGLYAAALTFSLLACACGNKTTQGNIQSNQPEAYSKISPDFNADSACYFVEKQVSFGPRVPNTQAHIDCGDYLVNELKRYGAAVTEQKANLKAYNGTILKSRNIIGTFDADKKDRVLLFAHWDSRPFADHDPNSENHHTPISGANDGGSGVGVLLEVARIIQTQSPSVGIDIIFFDSEDYGPHNSESRVTDADKYWCLGSQYWTNNPHVPGYKARFGILLDMVGAPDATFCKEYFSRKYAGGVVEKVWRTGRDLGYGRYFADKNGGAITDDHIPVNQVGGIPSVDIIQYDENTESGFGWYWHTVKDDMNTISKETLKAVGQTVLEVIYKEK